MKKSIKIQIFPDISTTRRK